jgi:hypothetical protein
MMAPINLEVPIKRHYLLLLYNKVIYRIICKLVQKKNICTFDNNIVYEMLKYFRSNHVLLPLRTGNIHHISIETNITTINVWVVGSP